MRKVNLTEDQKRKRERVEGLAYGWLGGFGFFGMISGYELDLNLMIILWAVPLSLLLFGYLIIGWEDEIDE